MKLMTVIGLSIASLRYLSCAQAMPLPQLALEGSKTPAIFTRDCLESEQKPDVSIEDNFEASADSERGISSFHDDFDLHQKGNDLSKKDQSLSQAIFSGNQNGENLPQENGAGGEKRDALSQTGFSGSQQSGPGN
jgi:hypothetical protein